MARARVLGGVFAWSSFGDFPDGKTLRVFRDADSFFSASQISTRGPPRKPHEMAQQVPAMVIPAGLEDEKKEKLKSVYQAMTNKRPSRSNKPSGLYLQSRKNQKMSQGPSVYFFGKFFFFRMDWTHFVMAGRS